MTINAFVWTHIPIILPSHEGVGEASEPINGPSEQCEQRKWFEQMFELLNFPPFHWGARCCLQKFRKKKQIYISPKTTDISNQAQQSKVHKGGIHGHTSCGRVGRGGNARFHTFWLVSMDRPTDGRTDRRTDKGSCRDACPQLKTHTCTHTNTRTHTHARKHAHPLHFTHYTPTKRKVKDRKVFSNTHRYFSRAYTEAVCFIDHRWLTMIAKSAVALD